MAFQPTFIGAPYYGGFAAPTYFSAPVAAAEQHSQAADEAHSQAVSVSGAAPAFFPQTYGTMLPQATVLPSTQFVPVAGPQIRRPGYNERLIAWRNRQKAFNRYKKATKQAIKNANRAQALAGYGYPAPFAAPAPTMFAGAPYGTAYGATYLPFASQYPVIYDQGFAAAAPAAAEGQEGYGEFNSYSQGQQQAEEVHTEEIRGTQV